jgi:uncharacterized membrane protein YtjA (UPF0391 family)
MLPWAFSFLLLDLSAGLLGFTGIAGTSTGFAKLLVFLFLPSFFVIVALALIVFLAARGRQGMLKRAELQRRNLLLSSPRRRERLALNNRPQA